MEAKISVEISGGLSSGVFLGVQTFDSREHHLPHNRSDCGAHHQKKSGGRRLRNFAKRLYRITVEAK